MERVFTKDLGRWHRGDLRDYPLVMWTHIAKSSGLRLDLISKPVEEVVVSGLPKLGRPLKEPDHVE